MGIADVAAERINTEADLRQAKASNPNTAARYLGSRQVETVAGGTVTVGQFTTSAAIAEGSALQLETRNSGATANVRTQPTV